MNLETLKNQTLLLLGKTRAFTGEEFLSQLEAHDISLTYEMNDEVRFIVEGRMMSPYEQNLSDALYEERKYEFLGIDVVEKLLADAMDDDVLLMSLKLSNDKARLKAFLQNSMLSDALFFKLLKMYSWNGEDFFENDDNRDVSAALIGRFYQNIERNHNVQYATTGIYHLIEQTQNTALLEAISALEPVRMHPKLKKSLAMHKDTPKSVLKKFLKQDDVLAKEAMAYNPNLDMTLIKELAKSEDLAEILAQNVKLDEALFTLLKDFKTALAMNETLNAAMQTQLLALDDRVVNLALANNRALTKESVVKLLAHNDAELNAALYANPATPKELLEEAFKDMNNYSHLAKNPAMPPQLLEAMFAEGDAVVLDALARNENTPVAVLYQLQLDSRFDRAVKTNAAFGKHIQSENIGWMV
ncbi:hypothetical protein [Sulfurimonas sp.]|uniref:hypothetical protein n=1 Tax=Sulfurimonas sp. TaxID=2022749 RepID=UPI00261951B0|nr:hypothetical protein [Sulfurimonas sp.]